MWHYVVIEIEKYPKPLEQIEMGEVLTPVPCWNILYQAPIEEVKRFINIQDDTILEDIAFKGCQVWIEQNKAPGSKYAIMKMFIV